MKNIIWHILRIISSLSMAIIVLLLIAILSFIGTVIEQDQTLDYYQVRYPSSQTAAKFLSWQKIRFLGLDHIYTNWWFISLLLFFFVSLLVCTFSRQLPSLKYSRKWKFLYKDQSLRKFNYYTCMDGVSLSDFIYSLNIKNYYVFHKSNSIYAYKGLIGRITPIFVHISLILTLIGSFIGMIGGFSTQEIIPKSEVSHLQNIIKSGYYSVVPNNLVCRVDDFYVNYYNNNSIQQFFSAVSILNNDGQVIVQKVLSVNKPLKFKGLTFYQTDWQISGLRIKIGNQYTIEKSLNKIINSDNGSIFWVCHLPIDFNHTISIVLSGLDGVISVYDNLGVLIIRTSCKTFNLFYNVPILVEEVIASTGLQIKADPGVNLIYWGFLILMISTLISYLSYSQIWANTTNRFISVGGTTNRASLVFENEISKIYSSYCMLVSVKR
uniref:Cytochrome c biogenesis protein CcsB n=1 Tax=Rhodogorgon sp. TaxID=2485824 RepID=A0A3G3MIA3_9FLOR|nr:c-type cytochrome biogenensis protein [Rhodogorgon sp.]